MNLFNLTFTKKLYPDFCRSLIFHLENYIICIFEVVYHSFLSIQMFKISKICAFHAPRLAKGQFAIKHIQLI